MSQYSSQPSDWPLSVAPLDDNGWRVTVEKDAQNTIVFDVTEEPNGEFAIVTGGTGQVPADRDVVSHFLADYAPRIRTAIDEYKKILP